MLSYAMVCEGATIGAGAELGPGVIVSYGVVVGPKHRVPPHTQLSLCAQVAREVGPGGVRGVQGVQGVQVRWVCALLGWACSACGLLTGCWHVCHTPRSSSDLFPPLPHIPQGNASDDELEYAPGAGKASGGGAKGKGRGGSGAQVGSRAMCSGQGAA